MLCNGGFIPWEEVQEYWNKRIGNPPGTKSTSFEAIREKDKIGRYCSRYFGKEYQKTVPEDVTGAGRFWGSNLKVEPTDAIEINFESKKERDKFFRPLNRHYNKVLLPEWGRKTGRNYKRSKKSRGFTVYQEGARVEQVIKRMALASPVTSVQLI